MPDEISAGDGAPPPAAPAVATPPAPTEGNASVLEYARRKLREREATGTKSAPKSRSQPKASAQKQPDAPETGTVSPTVLSQAAAESEKSDGSDTSDASDKSDTASSEAAPEEPSASEEGEAAQDDLALPEDAPEWLQKRIARFTRQKGDLERKLQATETERQQLQSEVERYKSAPAPEPPVPVVVSESDPASGIRNELQLEQAAIQARTLKRWCERNPEGGVLQVPDGKGGYSTREFTGEQVRAMKEATEDDLEQHFPRRREYLRAEQAHSSEALREFTWLTDRNSPQFAKFRKALADYPQIRLRPDWVSATAIFVEGLEAREARMKAAAKPPVAKPKPATPPPKVLGAPTAAPPRTGPKGALEADLAAAEKAWKEKSDARNFARLQAVKRQLREARV